MFVAYSKCCKLSEFTVNLDATIAAPPAQREGLASANLATANSSWPQAPAVPLCTQPVVDAFGWFRVCRWWCTPPTRSTPSQRTCCWLLLHGGDQEEWVAALLAMDHERNMTHQSFKAKANHPHTATTISRQLSLLFEFAAPRTRLNLCRVRQRWQDSVFRTISKHRCCPFSLGDDPASCCTVIGALPRS